MELPLEYILVYNAHNEKLDKKIIDFWNDENALPSKDIFEIQKRLNQVAYACVYQDKVIAVSSVESRYIKNLRGSFLYYRSFVGLDYRNIDLAKTLLENTYNHFNNISVNDIKGIYIIFESDILNKYISNYKHYTGTLIGFETNGNQIRVKYFDKATF